MKQEIKKLSLYTIKIGDLFNMVMDSDNISALSMYLGYAVNTPNPYPFKFNTLFGPSQINYQFGKYVIVTSQALGVSLTREELMELSYNLAETSGDQYSTLPILMDYSAWEDNGLEIFIHKTRSNVITLVYQDDREHADLPIGVYIDELKRLCYGVHAYSKREEEDIVSMYYFDDTSKANLI